MHTALYYCHVDLVRSLPRKSVPPPLYPRLRKRPAPPPVIRTTKQFFESVNPRGEFGDDGEALETYLYEKSLKIQPKDSDKPSHPDVKPRHSAATLRSPGIKAPRQSAASTGASNLESRVASFAASLGHVSSTAKNVYGRYQDREDAGSNKHTLPKTAPPTPGYDTGDNSQNSPDPSSSTTPHLSRAHSRPNAPPDDAPPAHFVLADVDTSRSRAKSASSKTATLPRMGAPPSLNAPATTVLTGPPVPPPILPRKATTKGSTVSGAINRSSPPPPPPINMLSPPMSAPSGAMPPPLHPRRATTSSGSGATSTTTAGSSPSTMTTSSRGSSAIDRPAAFVFPAPGSPPALPPRRVASGGAPSTSSPKEGGTSPAALYATTPTATDASSPNSLRVTLDGRVALSPTSDDSVSPTVSLSMPAPPALPPRRARLGTPASAPDAVPPPLPPKTNQSPPQLQAPPLPPKSYKRRMHSSSPTNNLEQ